MDDNGRCPARFPHADPRQRWLVFEEIEPPKSPNSWFGGVPSVLIWYGHFWRRDIYLEPFAGAGGIFCCADQPLRTETVNDKDAYVVNFLRCGIAPTSCGGDWADHRQRAIVSPATFQADPRMMRCAAIFLVGAGVGWANNGWRQ